MGRVEGGQGLGRRRLIKSTKRKALRWVLEGNEGMEPGCYECMGESFIDKTIITNMPFVLGVSCSEGISLCGLPSNIGF